MKKIEIHTLSPESPYLSKVIALADKNSKTLGHFPRDAFKQQAKKKYIIYSTHEKSLAGYLMFRPVQSRLTISITHLCISSEFRGKKIAKLLLDELNTRFNKKVRGLELNCLEEYFSACKLWKDYGFIPVSDKKSRSTKKEKNLILWFLDFKKPNLFSSQRTLSSNANKLSAMLDINILIKERENESEIKYIHADWLKNEVDFYTTKETYHEILRDKDRKRRKHTRSIKNKYKESNVDINTINSIAKELENKVLKGSSRNDDSDRMQLAESIGMEADYFITTDEGILKKGDFFLKAYGIHILSPSYFVQEIDQYINTENYQPIRLAGANITIKKIELTELNKVIDKFNSPANKEKRNAFKDKLSKIIIQQNSGQVRVVKTASKEIIAVIGNSSSADQSILKIVRLSKHFLSRILFKQIIYNHIKNSISRGIQIIKITEVFLSEKQKNILKQFRFKKVNDYWIKLGISAVIESKKLETVIPYAKEIMTQRSLSNLKKGGILDTSALYEIERTFFPTKFTDLEIPTYIIPIRPYWASQLFDNYMAQSSLFGASPLLAWNRENIYYRNVKPLTEILPARILWYASSEAHNPRSKAIIGCSYLDDTFIDKPREQFKRFNRFGVYSWKEVLKLAKNDYERDIKVLKFSDTEVFKKVIPLKRVQNILGKKYTFQGPVLIEQNHFEQLYKLGKNIK